MSLIGAAFLIPTDSPSSHHLFFVVCNNETHCLLVSLSTVREDRPCDRSCIIEPGEHPFVKKKSFVNYIRVKEELLSDILAWSANKSHIRKPDASEKLVSKIKKGGAKSKALPKKYKHYFQS